MGAAERDRKTIKRLPNEIERRPARRGALLDDGGGFRGLQGGDDRNVRFDDARFLESDFRQAVAEPFLMIESDRGENADDRLGGVGRVEPTAHAGLEDDDFDFAIAEVVEGERGHDLEKGRMRIPGGDQRADFRQADASTSSSEIISPFTCMRSRKVTRCGEVKSPVR